MDILRGLLANITIIAIIVIILASIIWIARQTKQKDDYPLWIIVLNIIACLPIIVAPFVLFTSIFIFDNPKSELLALLAFLAINSYSYLLYRASRFSLKLFKSNHKFVSAAIPIFTSLIVYGIIFAFFIH